MSALPAIALGAPSLRLRAVRARSIAMRTIALDDSIAGRALIADPEGPHRAIPDGNRSAGSGVSGIEPDEDPVVAPGSNE